MPGLVPSGKALATFEFEGLRLPELIVSSGEQTAEEFLTFFAGMIRNKNTRMAYLRAWKRFDEFCQAAGVRSINDLQPLHVAAYIESISDSMAPLSVKQHRAAISKCCDFLVVRQIIPTNPAASVAGPRVHQRKGKTHTLSDGEFLALMQSMPDSLVGTRDAAFISLMAYAWPRVSAAVGLTVGDYFQKGKRYYINVKEKGGKEATLLLHHKAHDALDAWIQRSGIADSPDAPLFPSFNRRRELTDRPLDRREAWAMVKRRSKAAGLDHNRITNHSFRATGITNYMSNGGRLDIAQEWANHADPRTTGMYDHSLDKVSTEEVERIRFEED